jgi:hypothetical protein
MNQNQLDHLVMYNAVSINLTNNHALYSANITVSAVVSAYQTQVSGLNALQVGQINNSKGITMSKAQVKANLINLTLAHADAGRFYAASIGNTPLKENLKLVRSDLERTQDGNLAAMCQNIYNQLNPLVASLGNYGVNAASLLALQTACTSFNGLVGKPKTARSSTKAYGISLGQQLAAIKVFVEEQLDPMMTQFKSTQVIFYNSYIADRKLQPAGHRTTVTITGIIVDAANAPIEKAEVILLETNRTNKITKANGVYKFIRLAIGTYTVQVVANGKALQTKTIVVSVAQTQTLNFTMQ